LRTKIFSNLPKGTERLRIWIVRGLGDKIDKIGKSLTFGLAGMRGFVREFAV